MIETARMHQVADRLQAGALVIVPTDTVYGVAAHPEVPDAVRRLYDAKGRSDAKPIPLLIDDTDALDALGVCLDAVEARLVAACWPGPLTVVVRVAGGSEGVRVPDCDVMRELLRLCGGALRVTSANRSGEPPALTADAAREALGEWIDDVLDAGPAPGGTPSTVVRVQADEVEILREGAISEEEIRRLAGGS